MSVAAESEGRGERGRLFPRSWLASSRLIDLVVLVAGIVGFGGASVLLGIDTGYDLRNYHLYIPYASLHDRYAVDIAPAQLHTYITPTYDFLFYALVATLNDQPRLIAFIMGAIHGLNVFLLYRIAMVVVGPGAGWWRTPLAAVAALIGITGSATVSLVGTTSNDLFGSVLILASLRMMLTSAGTAERSRWLPAGASALLGIAVGCKYVDAFYAPGLAVLVLWAAAGMRRWWLVLASSAGGFTAGFLLSAGYHMAAMWRQYGSPVFPLLNNIFGSPYGEPVSSIDQRFLPYSILRLVAYPFYWARLNQWVVSEAVFRDTRAAIAYVLVAIAAIAWLVMQRSRRPGDRLAAVALPMLIAFAAASYFAWAYLFGIYRYAVALELLTGPVIVGAILVIARNPRIATGLAVAALVVATGTTKYYRWGRAPFGPAYVSVDAAPIPDGSQVIIFGEEPLSFLIPYLNPTARFIGLQNHFVSLYASNRLAAAARAALAEPVPDRFILLAGDANHRIIDATLLQRNLRVDYRACRPIKSDLMVMETAILCRIR